MLKENNKRPVLSPYGPPDKISAQDWLPLSKFYCLQKQLSIFLSFYIKSCESFSMPSRARLCQAFYGKGLFQKRNLFLSHGEPAKSFRLESKWLLNRLYIGHKPGYCQWSQFCVFIAHMCESLWNFKTMTPSICQSVSTRDTKYTLLQHKFRQAFKMEVLSEMLSRYVVCEGNTIKIWC